jgi:hypothetical protein
MKSMTAKQKRMFEMGAIKLMDEILEDTGTGKGSSTGLSKTFTVFYTTSGLRSLQ